MDGCEWVMSAFTCQPEKLSFEVHAIPKCLSNGHALRGLYFGVQLAQNSEEDGCSRPLLN